MELLSQFLAMLAGLLAQAPQAPQAAAAPDVPVHNCPSGLSAHLHRQPMESGPLRLAAISCVDFESGSFGYSDAILSPDGDSAARWHEGAPAPIEIVALSRPGRVSLPGRVAFRNFASIFGNAPDALAWARDSRSLWGVRQRTGSPAGWALAGLEPISIGRDGSVRALPPLRHPAGPLDALMWVGGDGLALAQFGARGTYYRPAHDDRSPTLAMVDAARGRLLAALPASSLPGLPARLRAHGLRTSIAGAAAVILPGGRIRTVIQFRGWGERPLGTAPGANWEPIVHAGFWLVWTQGRPPRIWADPYPGDRANPLALSPDGSKLLVIRQLQPAGVQISCRIPCRQPPPPPEPVSDPIAELVDLASRRVLWRVPARAEIFWGQSAAPAISGDGLYALIELPTTAEHKWIALLDMRDGRILQRLAPNQAGSYPQSFGFTGDGRRAWVSCGNLMLVYDLPRR